MNPRVQKLVDALRSGEYEQGLNRLRTNDTYCCLGVACDVYHKETGDGKWRGSDPFPGSIYAFHYGPLAVDNELYHLPETVREWFGFRSNEGQFGEGLGATLVALNDGGRLFEEIANTIEEQQENLFTS